MVQTTGASLPIALLCSGALLFGGLLAPKVARADGDSARNKGVAWLIQQQRGDGSWASVDGTLAVQATSSALAALKAAGVSRSPSFGAASGWLVNADADSVDSIARKVEGLVAAGLTASAQTEADRLYGLRSLAISATWSGYGGSGIDHVDTALGLSALRTGDINYLSKTSPLAGALCSLALGRVPVATGKQAWPPTQTSLGQSPAQGRPSVVATALVLHELRALQLRTGFPSVTCNSVNYTLATLQSEGQAWLLDQQNADGGFGEQRTDGSKGPSMVLVTALALRQLNGLASPPQPQTTNALNWLLGQQDSVSGHWRNDPLVTATALAALPPAAGVQLTDSDRDGIPDRIEQVLSGANPALADARSHLDPPSLAIAGATTSGFAAGAILGRAFDYSLSGVGTAALSSGSLPPGLSLNATTGRISGVPTRLGAYSFDYRVGASELAIGRIDVEVAAADPVGDVPLPGWAIALLAGLLGASAVKHQRRRV